MKTFEFSRKGLEAALKHKDYIGIAKQTIEEHPEVFPLALAVALGISVVLLSPAASAVAYKSMEGEVSKIAFKYMIH